MINIHNWKNNINIYKNIQLYREGVNQFWLFNYIRLLLSFWLLEFLVAVLFAGIILTYNSSISTKLSLSAVSDSVNSCILEVTAAGIKTQRAVNVDKNPNEIEIITSANRFRKVSINIRTEKPVLLSNFKIDNISLTKKASVLLGRKKVSDNSVRVEKGVSVLAIEGLDIDKGYSQQDAKCLVFIFLAIVYLTPFILLALRKKVALLSSPIKTELYALHVLSVFKICAVVFIPAITFYQLTFPSSLTSSLYTFSFDVYADHQNTANFSVGYTLHDFDDFKKQDSVTISRYVGLNKTHVDMVIKAPYIRRFRFEPHSNERLFISNINLDGIKLLDQCRNFVFSGMPEHSCYGERLEILNKNQGAVIFDRIADLGDHMYSAKKYAYVFFVLSVLFSLFFILFRKEIHCGTHKSLIRSGVADLVAVSLSFWLAVFAVFAYLIQRMFVSGGDTMYGVLHVIAHHYPVYLVIIFSLFMANVIRNQLCKLVPLLLLIIFSTLVVSDFVVLRELNAKVIISQIFTFTDGLAGSFDIVSHFFKSWFGMAVLLFSSLTVLAALTSLLGNSVKKKPYACTSEFCLKKHKKLIRTIIVAVILVATMPLLYILDGKMNPTLADRRFKNFLELSNTAAFRNFRKAYTAVPGRQPSFIVKEGLGAHHNVIFILTESLSSYKSMFFSGLGNETPRLDKIAENALSFKNHHSNGFNTAVSTFSILTGLPYINSSHGYTDSRYFRSSLIKDFKKEGYYALMMYSCQDVAGINSLYKQAGFDEISTGSDQFYRNSRRLTFHSVPDHDIFENALQKISKLTKAGKPFFTMIMTATNHTPFRVPDAPAEYSYEKTLAYTDDEIAEFVSKLEKTGFFNDGIVVITGDHRAMQPVYYEEIKKFGNGAVTRVPLIIKGADINSEVIERDTAHDSVRAILGYLELDNYPLYSFQLNPLTDKERSEDILYQKYDPSDEVMIESGKKVYYYHLEGDSSTFIGTEPEKNKADAWAGLIYFLRQGDIK